MADKAGDADKSSPDKASSDRSSEKGKGKGKSSSHTKTLCTVCDSQMCFNSEVWVRGIRYCITISTKS